MLTMIFIIVMAFISMMFKGIGKKILLLFVFVFTSIVLFLISFIVGGWEGIGLGAISISLFVASFIALIVIVLLDYTMHKRLVINEM